MLKNIFSNRSRNIVLLTQIINAVIALVSGKLIASFIAPEQFGIYSLQWAIVVFFSSILIAPFLQYVKSTETTNMKIIGVRFYFITAIILIVISTIAVSIFLNFYNDSLNLILFLILLFFIPIYTFNGILSNHLNISGQIKLFCYSSILKALAGLLFLLLYFFLDIYWLSDSQMLWLMQVVSIFVGSVFFANKYTVVKGSRKIAFDTFLK